MTVIGKKLKSARTSIIILMRKINGIINLLFWFDQFNITDVKDLRLQMINDKDLSTL